MVPVDGNADREHFALARKGALEDDPITSDRFRTLLLAGHGTRRGARPKVWNSKKNLLTKCQDAWYDYSFNIHKATESSLGNVTCCSGCLAGYRREVIEDFLPYWKDSAIQYSDDRSLTTYVIAKSWVKKELAPISAHLLHSSAKYDDAEDRILTAQSLLNWKSVTFHRQLYTQKFQKNFEVMYNSRLDGRKVTFALIFL